MRIEILEEEGIPYKFVTTKQPKISIAISKDAQVYIRYNPIFTEEQIEVFVENNLEWINSQFLKYYKPPRNYKTGEKYLLYGKEYTILKVATDNDKVFIDKNYLIIHTKKDDFSYIDKLVDQYKKASSEESFHIILDKCFNKMIFYLKKYPILTIKRYKSRWGCCLIKENRIVLNIALVHVPVYLIEYVCYHELCHFIYPNHSKEFHNLLERFVPNEKRLRHELNQYNTLYN